MEDFRVVVGQAMKKARLEQHLTQQQLSELSGVDVRVISNIERFEGNPKLENLYALIHTLQADAREVFGMKCEIISPDAKKMHQIINSLTDEEASDMLTIMESVLHFPLKGASNV